LNITQQEFKIRVKNQHFTMLDNTTSE